jgi:hypothetical protein
MCPSGPPSLRTCATGIQSLSCHRMTASSSVGIQKHQDILHCVALTRTRFQDELKPVIYCVRVELYG